VRSAAPPRPPQRHSNTARTGTFAVLIVLVLIVLLAILILLFTGNSKGGGEDGGTVAVPSLINKTRAEAEKDLSDAKLKAQVLEQDNAQYEAGKVFKQEPAGGTKVDEGTTVVLTVSKGTSIAVKSVIGSNVDDAEATLRGQGFEVERVPDPKSSRPDGEVTAQNPVPGALLAAGQKVTITFSSPEEKIVRDVSNQTAAAAAAALARDGFDVQEAQEASDTIEPGKVIRTDPPANSKLKVGQKITIFISSGPAQALVPDVVGLFSPTAQQTLEQSGFIVAAKFQDVPSGSPNVGRVIDQTPSGNTSAKKGATVTITVGRATSTTTTAPSATTTTPPSGTTSAPKKNE
jgi:serine/threonine-protein kinase